MALDPTKIQIDSHQPPIWEREESFQEIMADQLRHAPWLMLSALIHGIALFMAYLLATGGDLNDSDKQIVMKPAEEEEIIEPPPPEEEPPDCADRGVFEFPPNKNTPQSRHHCRSLTKPV